jgi:cell division protein FtsI/penicillin-binding protein 2
MAAFAVATSKPPAKKTVVQPAKKSAASARSAKPSKTAAVSSSRKPATKKKVSRRRWYRNPWTEPTYADSTVGDRIFGEDLLVRRAAVEALGPYNGSVMVTDAGTGRILTIVNQKLAFQSGFTPCSTIKLVTSVAGLVEGVITPETALKVSRRERMNLTSALARSNNPYFQIVGRELGFERVAYYARMLGVGEKAGLNIPEEQAGSLPGSDPRANGGVGLMCSHGIGVELTPIQLSAMLAMIANNGTLPWLQYPRSAAEVEAFIPQMKRQMDLGTVVDMLRPGMEGAVEWGSGQRARRYAESDEPIFGKTGTCTHTDQRTHLGWFGSYNQVGERKLVVVVLLTGGRPVNGPVASGIAGGVYKILKGQNYYASAEPGLPEVLRAATSEAQ